MTAAPFRRRSRKYRDNLLDNLEADKPLDRSALQKPQTDNQRQPARPTRDRSLQSSAPTPNSSSDVAEEGIGWGDGGGGGGAPDDWGWGLENPTLAAATGSYRSELQAQNGASGQSSRSSWSTPAQSGTTDNWDGSELEEEEDWDDEAVAADDEAADSSPDVTVLDSSEVVCRMLCLTDYLSKLAATILHHLHTAFLLTEFSCMLMMALAAMCHAQIMVHCTTKHACQELAAAVNMYLLHTHVLPSCLHQGC